MVLYRRDTTPGATWFFTLTQHVAWVERSDTQGTFSRVSLRSTRATFEGVFFCKGLQQWCFTAVTQRQA